jgi:Secretion system C-terminal sorting domain
MIKFIGPTSLLLLWAMVCGAQEIASSSNPKPQMGVVASKTPMFADFNCALKSPSIVELQWRTENNKEGDYFLVERSIDGSHYETVSVQTISDTTTWYSQQDSPPASYPEDFYRIKYISKSGVFFYSKPIQVNLGGAEVDFKFYPNPADKLLIIRSGHDVGVEISDSLGVVRISKQLQAGLQIVNVASLEKGSYLLKVSDPQSNKFVTQPLVKN